MWEGKKEDVKLDACAGGDEDGGMELITLGEFRTHVYTNTYLCTRARMPNKHDRLRVYNSIVHALVANTYVVLWGTMCVATY